MAYPRKEVSDQGIDYMCRVVDFAADLGGNGVIINPTRLTKWTPLAELEQEQGWWRMQNVRHPLLIRCLLK